MGSNATSLYLVPPLVFAHWLPWFINQPEDFPLPADHPARPPNPAVLAPGRHWSDPDSGYTSSHLHWPENGRYDSRDPVVIRRQIKQARSAGITGFTVNWYGINSAENVITLSFLAELERWNAEHPSELFLYFFCIDSQAQLPTEGKTPAPLQEDLAYIRDHLLKPGYLLRDNRPIFACFPYRDDAPDWLTALAHVFGPDGSDFLWSGSGEGVGECGCYAWIAPSSENVRANQLYPWPTPDDSGAEHAGALYQAWNRPELNHRYGMAGVWPGFNDQLVTWAWKNPAAQDRARPRIINRETSTGNTYERTWKIYHDYLSNMASGSPAHQLPIPLVQIATWNDYAEATTIEPTKDYGSHYLDLTKVAISQARELWPKKS